MHSCYSDMELDDQHEREALVRKVEQDRQLEDAARRAPAPVEPDDGSAP